MSDNIQAEDKLRATVKKLRLMSNHLKTAADHIELALNIRDTLNDIGKGQATAEDVIDHVEKFTKAAK